MIEKSGLIDTSQKYWTDSSSEPDFLQLRLFSGVRIKKNPYENKKKPLKVISIENEIKAFDSRWPW